ncbi:G patch domain-containing protein 8-like isoform X1 [Arapaima gigas]
MESCGSKMADRFSRFNEDRDFQGGNHFDQYDDGQLELEQASLDKPIESDNIGHRLLQKHGWKLGQGLGKSMQGRTDPVPIILKYDVMGMGRMEMELDYAEDATEKRRVLEVEKEDTEELRQKYKDYAEKEKAIAKALEDLRANFYCELCDKQYQKHQEFDNHINSYDHAHKQRLKELKQREFARNVSSRSRKDERKQEKILRRLHELAEQRKQQDCAPGSGPMFKATTVVVDGESNEEGLVETLSIADQSVEGSSCQEKALANSGQPPNVPSPKLATTLSFAVNRNSSSPSSNASLIPKVSVSFSFAKKTPIKLETAAAVFADQGEETLVEGSQEEEEISGTPRVASLESPNEEEQQQQPDEGSSLASTLSKLKMMMKRDEGTSGQEPQYYHYVPPAHCRVKPNFQFLIFMKASDQTSSCEVEEEDSAATTTLASPPQEQTKAVEAKSEKEENVSEKQKETESVSDPSTMKIEEESRGCSGGSDLSSEDPSTSNQCTSESHTGPRLRTEPFFPVLSKDESTTLQWPSELLEFTQTQPSLSYSCNPLYFDFKLSRNKSRVGKQLCGANSNKLGKTDKEDLDRSKQEPVQVVVEVAPARPITEKGDTQSAKEEEMDREADRRRVENTSSKKKKKKKKHKKSSKHSKRKDREKDTVEGDGEMEAISKKSKKKKKHKQKKSKSKVSEEDKGKEKEEGGKVSPATGVQGTETGKRKRPLKEELRKPACEKEVRKGSEEHNGAKRHKRDPGSLDSASATASTSLGQKRSSSDRAWDSKHGSSESEDGGSSSQHSPQYNSRPRQRQRRYSEDSERSRSRSSRRRGRHQHRGPSSRSRSYSSSSERSSGGSSHYSYHSRSYSDSYSEYSDRSRRPSKDSSDSEYERHRSQRRHYYSSSSEAESSRSRSRPRRWRHRHSSSRSYSGSSSPRSWRRSSYSRSRSSASRTSSSAKGSPSHRRRHRHDESSSRRAFNRSRIYRSQSPRTSPRGPPRKDSSRNSSSFALPRTSGMSRSTSDRGGSRERTSLTARQLLEKIQSRKGSEESTAGAKSGIKLKDPPQGYFGPKLPPTLGNKGMLPLFGKLPMGKKSVQPQRRLEEAEKAASSENADAGGEVILVEPIREFPPPPPPPPAQQVEENTKATVVQENALPTPEAQVVQESGLYEQESGMLVQTYQTETGPDTANTGLEPLLPDMQQHIAQQHVPQQQQPLHPYQGYPTLGLEEEDLGIETEEDSSLAPLESQPITFTPEEMEKYSKLQQAAQQHIQQQLLAKQVKTFPSASAAAAHAVSLTPAPPPPALQQIHIQQPAAAPSATTITTVQHAILQHHAATAAAIGIHPHAQHPHPHQLAQVHHIPQHHLTPISLSPLGPTLGHSLGHSLFPAHPTAFLSGQPIHIIPASALHPTPLALHHVPHTALYPTLFAPRPSAAAAAAALHLHPLLHPIFSGQDLQHPPSHGS